MPGIQGAMKAGLLAGLVALFAGVPASAQETPEDSAVAELRRQLEELELRVARQEAELLGLLERGYAADVPAQVAGRTPPDQRQRMVSGLASRPFVWKSGQGTVLGGYVDLEFQADLDEDESEFDQHRLIPFIFAEITPRIHFGTELEFEHGGEEIKVEFAAVDVAVRDWLNFRGGIVLAPLGKFNLIHDSPVNDLTERPLVNRQLIPTTLSEAGVGLFGTIYPSERSVVTYEGYVVNGFDEGLLSVSGGAPAVRLRSGRGGLGSDNNDAKSLVGRLTYSPFLGLEVGASAHTGVYAPADAPLFEGDERLTIWALDGFAARGPFELLAEYARATIDAPAGLGAVDFPDAQDGFYVQGNYHFGHGWVPLFDNSIFTGVARFGGVDFDSDLDGDAVRRLTLGLNWRPVEETVFKLDYLNDWSAERGGDWGDASQRIFFSLATYF